MNGVRKGVVHGIPFGITAAAYSRRDTRTTENGKPPEPLY